VNRPTIAAATAAALVACSPSGPAAQISEIPRGNPPTSRHTREQDAPDTTEPTTSTTVAVATTSTTAPPVTVEVFELPESRPAIDDEGWWDRERLLSCIRSYEQGAAGYATSTGNGYEGAYQFVPATWAEAVTGAGHPEWAGRPASSAPGWVQDDAAWWLVENYGLGPWPTPKARCGA
jgi:hypothetical protein